VLGEIVDRRPSGARHLFADPFVESNVLLGQVSDFARNRVEARARILDGAMKAHAE